MPGGQRRLLTGALFGALLGAFLLGSYLLEWLAAAGPWRVLRRLDLIAGLTVGAGLAAGVWTNVMNTWITRPDGLTQSAIAFGLDRPWPGDAGYGLASGASLSFRDVEGTPVAYLVERLARNLFGADPAVGREVVLSHGRIRATVGGVLEPRPEGLPDRLGDRDASRLSSLETDTARQQVLLAALEMPA
ncbi:MAG: ABC transporter permease [Bacillota bacterium]|jgi:hypothetical protein